MYGFFLHLFLFLANYLWKSLSCFTCRISHTLDFANHLFMVQPDPLFSNPANLQLYLGDENIDSNRLPLSKWYHLVPTGLWEPTWLPGLLLIFCSSSLSEILCCHINLSSSSVLKFQSLVWHSLLLMASKPLCFSEEYGHFIFSSFPFVFSWTSILEQDQSSCQDKMVAWHYSSPWGIS